LDTIVLRPLCATDDSFLREVYASTRQDDLALLPEPIGSQLVNSQYELQRAHYLANYPAATWSVIEYLAQPVGRMIVDRSSDPWCLIDIAVVTAWRNHGIGTRLIESLLIEVAQADVELVLSVRVDNIAARRLYERLGLLKRDEIGAYISLSTVAERRVE
jgi:GNAT superfamily N-acetyltransferase